jgi:MFS family permease
VYDLISNSIKGVPDSKIRILSNIFYLGEIFGCISIARVPDVHGRKWPFLISVAIQLPCYVTLLVSKSLTLNTCLSFIMGFLHIGIYNGGYVNVCEYVNTPWKNNVCTVLMAFDMLSTILIGVYF